MPCLWPIRDLFMICSKLVHNLFMTCSWLFQYWLVPCLWDVHDFLELPNKTTLLELLHLNQSTWPTSLTLQCLTLLPLQYVTWTNSLELLYLKYFTKVIELQLLHLNLFQSKYFTCTTLLRLLHLIYLNWSTSQSFEFAKVKNLIGKLAWAWHSSAPACYSSLSDSLWSPWVWVKSLVWWVYSNQTKILAPPEILIQNNFASKDFG